jgi:hypothetical protein
MIIENISLSELKDFLISQNLSQKYTASNQEQWYRHTTPEGMDAQNSYEKKDVCAKFWIQYFPLSNQFALNVNFFANIDGAPIGPQDFIRLIPEATRPYEYYNSEKIQWKYQDGIYLKIKPDICPFNLYPNILTITANNG